MSSPSRPNTYRPIGPSSSNYQKRNSSFNRNKAPRGPRRNEAIRIPSIRVVGPAGEALGIMPTQEALALARKLQLDLIEIAPNASPPVCRIIDFGKYMYEENKKQSGAKKNASKLKEVKLRPNIDKHDYETKTRRAEDFLMDGHKVKFTITMRGREMDNPKVAIDLFRRIVETLKEAGTLPDPHFIPKPSGRNLSFMLSPTPNAKRKASKDESDEDDRPSSEEKKKPAKLSSPFEGL
jgi:translation initiation factor IF-3